ncbi:MAG: TetR/AcrR family transcriptional regulator [Candidatus Dormibacteraeota bacterium]|nr:TetR/AcrR family transcriptional regulator [Candidatus Dormibacteraeota bacterium]
MASRRHTDTALLDAARECVATVGVRRTTVADVARRAGASRMTVYRLFPDAKTLWSMLLTREFGEIIAEAERTVAGLPTARERLVAATIHAVERISGDPVVRRVLELDPDLLLPYMTERLGQSQHIAIQQFSRFIEAGRNDGSIRDVDESAAVYLLQLVVGSVVLATRVTERETDTTRVLAELARMLDAYLAPAAVRAA